MFLPAFHHVQLLILQLLVTNPDNPEVYLSGAKQHLFHTQEEAEAFFKDAQLAGEVAKLSL